MASDDRSRDDLVTAFWLHHRLGLGDRAERLASAEHFWAWEAVEALVGEGGLDAVAIVVELAEAVANDEAALCYVGAGPIEGLLATGSPSPVVVAALDRAAEEYESVRIAIRCVWWSDDADRDLVERFSRFGQPL